MTSTYSELHTIGWTEAAELRASSQDVARFLAGIDADIAETFWTWCIYNLAKRLRRGESWPPVVTTVEGRKLVTVFDLSKRAFAHFDHALLSELTPHIAGEREIESTE